jgi:hypothetical protein
MKVRHKILTEIQDPWWTGSKMAAVRKMHTHVQGILKRIKKEQPTHMIV